MLADYAVGLLWSHGASESREIVNIVDSSVTQSKDITA